MRVLGVVALGGALCGDAGSKFDDGMSSSLDDKTLSREDDAIVHMFARCFETGESMCPKHKLAGRNVAILVPAP